MPFPYISQIIVHDCFTYQNLKIPHEELEAFKHIIITGKNGSGKTTILNRVALLLGNLKKGYSKSKSIAIIESFIKYEYPHLSMQSVSDLEGVDLKHLRGDDEFLKKNTDEYVMAHFKAHRKVELNEVKTVTKESEFLKNLNKEENKDDLINHFKQYLVNKKVYEAFDAMNAKDDKTSQSKKFFKNLRENLRSIFGDKNLQLNFVQEEFEFYLEFSDGRKVTFNQLSDGFSAYLSIVMELLMRTDLLRKAKKDYSLDPQGIVLIDEPETHFHLSMQYEILPLLNKLFPNIQLVIATHSPAIISSLENAIVYDLSSKEEVEDWVIGSSYSELMVRHFGLDNEYSPVADKILYGVNEAVKHKDIKALKKLLADYENYLTPVLRLEIESQIINIESTLG